MSVAPELELEQKAFRTRVNYRFFDDYVEYTIRDASGGRTSFNVKYSNLPSKFDYHVYRPATRPTMAAQLSWAMFLVLLLIIFYRPQTPAQIALMIIYSVILIGGLVYLRQGFRNTYTSIATAKGKVLILRDQRHDEVLQALESRRTAALRKFAVINPLNPAQAELQRFIWLKDQGIISEQEFEILRQKLTNAQQFNVSPPPTKPPGETVQ